MAQPFNLTAQLNVTGPVGLRPVVNTIRKQLAGINTNVNVQISQQSARHVKNLNSQILALNKSLQTANGSAASLNAQMASLGKSVSNLGGSSGKASKGLSNVANNANQAASQLKVASTQMQEFGRISGLALRRYAGFTVATTITFGFVRAVSDAVSEAIKFDRELVKISQVTGRSMNSLKSLTAEIGRLSTGLGVSSTELLEVSRILAQTGMRASEVRRSLDALAKSTLAPTFNDIKNTAEGAVAAMAQFKIGARDLERVLGSINAVAGRFAVESEDLISVIRRTGGVFKAAAGDIGTPINQLNELIAIFTSVRSTTRESADSIAVGLRTIFSRIQRPRTIQFLKQFGVELNDLNGKFVGPFEAMKRLSQAFKELDTRDVRFAKIVEELGGFRQVGKLIPAITQFAKAQDALRVAQQGQGSLARDAQKAQQALAVQISKTREEFSRLIREFSETDSFRLVAKTALEIANSMIRLADSLKPVLPLITAVTAVKGLGALRQFGSGFFGGIRQAGGAGAVGAGLAGAATGQGAAQAAKTTATSNRQLSSVLNNVAKQMTANTTATSQASKNLVTSQQNLANKLGSLTLAIGNLTRAISMQTPFRGGGGGRRPRGFASGGMVPGTGNYDNYPAMLTPGEFVIRKSAVKQIGEGYLNSVNRYASGGRVVKSRSGYGIRDIFRGARQQRAALQDRMKTSLPQKEEDYARGRDVDFVIKEPPNYGAFYFTKTRTESEKPKTGKASIAFSKISKEKQSQLASLTGASSSDLIKSKVIGFPEAYFPRASVGKKFRGATKKGLKSMVDTVVQKALQLKPQGFVNSLPADERPSISSFYNQVKKGIGFESIEGKMWEAFLGAFGNQISNDTRGTWDFPGVKGKGALSKVFGRGVMTLNHADAKRTYSQSMIASVIDKAVNNKVAPLHPIIPTQQATARDIESKFKGMSAFGGKTQGIQIQRGTAMRKFASGGSVSDTVPALLTPGEFVINRTAASRIGLGNLTKMNRGEIPGYASGGLVTASRAEYGPGNRRWFERFRRNRGQQQAPDEGGRGGMGMGGAGMGLLFGAPMIGQMIAGDTPLQDRTLGSIRTSDAISQGGALGGTAAMLGAGPFASVTAGLIGVANGAMEAEQKLKEAIAADELQQASKDVQDVFEKFGKGAATMAELATSLQDMNNAARRREGVLADPAMNLTGLIARGAGGDAASAGLIQQAGIMATLIASLTDLVGMTEDAQDKLFKQTVDAGIFSQLERAQAQADEIAPIFNKLISDSYDVGKSWQENMAKLRGNDAFNQAVEAMARADAKIGKAIAAYEQHAARTGQDMSASINDLIVTWSETTGKAMVDQIRIAKELEDAAKKSTIALDMVITRMQAMSAVSSRAGSAMDNARRINTMQVETRLGQPKFQASNRFSNVFGNIRGFSSSEVSDTLDALETRIGSGAASSAVFQEARRGTEISVQARELIPQIIQSLPVGSDVNQLRAEMEKGVLAGAPQATKDMFDKIFTEIEAMGAQSKDKSLAEIAQSPEIMEKINAAGEASAKAIQDLAKAVDKEAQAMAKELNKLTKMILDTSEKFEDVNQIRFQQQAQMADIEGRELTLRESFAPIESQIKSLTSISGGPNAGTMDPQMIGSRLTQLRRQREQARKDVDAGLPGAAEKVSELDAAITGAAKALELLKTNTTRQAAIVEKINRLEQIRSGARNMVEAFMVGDVEAQRRFGMQAQALNMFQGAAARGQEQQFMAHANPMVRQLLLEGIRGDMGNMLAPEARKKLEDQMFGGFMGAMGVDRDHALNRAVMGEGFGGLDRGDLIGQLHEVNQQQLEAARQLAGMASGAEQQQRDFLNKAAQLFAQELEKHLNRVTNTGVIRKNAGGTVPGTGSSDTVRAMLTPGEFVINKAATAQNLPLLRDINKHGATQKFAKGGMVQGRGKIHRFRDGGPIPEEQYPNLDGQWAILKPYDLDDNNKLSNEEYDIWWNSFKDPIAQAAAVSLFGRYQRAKTPQQEAMIQLGLDVPTTEQIIAETDAAVEAHAEVIEKTGIDANKVVGAVGIGLAGAAAYKGYGVFQRRRTNTKNYEEFKSRYGNLEGGDLTRRQYVNLNEQQRTSLTSSLEQKLDKVAEAEAKAAEVEAKAADVEAKASRTTAHAVGPDRIDPLAPTGVSGLADADVEESINRERATRAAQAAQAKADAEAEVKAKAEAENQRKAAAAQKEVEQLKTDQQAAKEAEIRQNQIDAQKRADAQAKAKAEAAAAKQANLEAEYAQSRASAREAQATFDRLQNSSTTAQDKIATNRRNYQTLIDERAKLRNRQDLLAERARLSDLEAKSAFGKRPLLEGGRPYAESIADIDSKLRHLDSIETQIARNQQDFKRLEAIKDSLNTTKSNAALDVEMHKYVGDVKGRAAGIQYEGRWKVPAVDGEGPPKINPNITGTQMESVGKFRKVMRGLGKTLPVVGTGFDIYAVGAGIYHKDPMMISRALNDVGLDIATLGVKPTVELSTELGRWGMQGAGWVGEKLGYSDGSLREAYSLDEGEEGTLDAYYKRGMEIAHRAALTEQSESDMSLRGASQARVLDKYRRMGVEGKTKLSKEFMQVVGKMSAQNYIKYLSPKYRPKPIGDSRHAGHGLDATTYTPAGGESSGWAGAKIPLPSWLGGRLGDFFEEFKYDWDADEFFNTFLAVGDENSKKTFDITGGGAIQSRSALNEAISNPELLKLAPHKRDLEIDKDLRDKWTAYGRMPTRDWVSKVTANKGHQALSEIIYNSMLAQRDLMYEFPGAFGFKEVQGKIGGRVRQNMAWWEQQNELFAGFDTLNSRKLEEKQKEIVDNYAMSVTEAGRFNTGGTWPLNSDPTLKGSAEDLARLAALSQTMWEWMLKMPSDGSPTRRPWMRITKAQEEGFDWSTAEYEPVGEKKVEDYLFQEWAKLYKNGPELIGGKNVLMPFATWDSSNTGMGFDVSKLSRYKSWGFSNEEISKKFSKRDFWTEALSRHSIGGLTLPFSLVDGGGASGWPLNLSGHKSGSKIAGMTTPLYFNTARMGIGFNEVASRIEDEYLNAQTRIGTEASRALMEAGASERNQFSDLQEKTFKGEVAAGVPVKDLAADAIGPISADLLTNAFKEISTMMSVWGFSGTTKGVSAGEYPVISKDQQSPDSLKKVLAAASGWMVEGAKSPYETLSRLVTGMNTEKYKSLVDEFNYPSRDFYDALVAAGTGLYDSVYSDWEKVRREGKTISGAMGTLPWHASTGHLPSHFAYTPAFFGVSSFDNIPDSAYSNPASFVKEQTEGIHSLKNMRNWLIDNYRHHSGTITTPSGEKRTLNMYFPMIEGTRNLDQQQLTALHADLTADPDIKAAQILALIQKHGGELGITDLGNVYKKNSGGRIPGYGTSDTVPAMLTPGEFVVNASSAQSNMGLLHAINSGSLRGYNAGGVVRRFQEGGEAKEDKKGSFSMPSNETLTNMLLDWGYGTHNVKSFYEPQWWAKHNAEAYKRYDFHPDDSIWMNSGEQSPDKLNGNIARWLSADFMEVKGIATAAGDRPIRSFSDVHSFSFTLDDRFNKPLKYTPTKNPLEYLKKILGSDDIDKWADRHYIFPPHFDEHVARQALHKVASENYDSVSNELQRMNEWSDALWQHYVELDRSWVLVDGQTKEEIEKNKRAQYKNTKTNDTEWRTLDDTDIALAKMRIDMKNGVIPKPPAKPEAKPEAAPKPAGANGDNGAPAAEKPKPRTLSDEQGQLHQEAQQFSEDYGLGGDKGAYFAALADESAITEAMLAEPGSGGNYASDYMATQQGADDLGTSAAKQGPWKKKKQGGGELATVKDVTVTEAMTENKKGYTTSNYGMRRFRFLGPDKEGWRPQDGQTPFSLNEAGELKGSHIKAGEVYDFEKETARKDSQLKVPAKWGMPSGKRVNNMGAYLDLLYSYAGKFGATFQEMQKPDFAPNEGFSKEWMHMLDFIKEGPAVGKKVKDTIIKAEKEGGGGAVIRGGLDNPGMAIGGPLAELAKEANFTPLRLSVSASDDDISTVDVVTGNVGSLDFVNSIYSLLDMASDPTAIKSGDLYIDEGSVWSAAKKQFKSKGPYAIAGFTREPNQTAIEYAQSALGLLANAIYPAMSFKDWNSDIMSKEAILGKMANAGITNNHPSFQEASAIAELYDQWNGAYTNNSDENDWAAAHSHFYRSFFESLPKEHRDNLMSRALPLIQAAHERGRERQNRLNTLLTTAGAQKPRQVTSNVKFNKGGFLPRYKYGGQAGVDSIPAMLTPGEFVINADAASKNLGLLERINSGSPPQGYNNGGRVQRFQRGGRGESRTSVTVGGGELAAAIAAFNQTSAPKLATAMMTFNTSANNLAGALTSFGTTAGQLAKAIKSLETMNIPERITLDMADSTVTLTGESTLASALSNVIGGRLGSIIAEAVSALTGTNVDGSPTGQER